MKATLVVVLLLLASGCLQVRVKQPDAITWGIGLDIKGKPLPEPGPFVEGPENVTALARVLNVTLPQVLQDCGEPSRNQTMRRALDNNDLLFAIEKTFDACAGDWGSAARALARTASTDSERLRLYLDTRARARAAVESEAATLSRLPPPGTVIDALVQGHLMYYNGAWHAAILQTAALSYEAYNQTHADIDWVNVFTNLILAASVNATKDFAMRYPWTPGTCDLPDFDLVKQEIGEKIRHLLNEQRGDARNLTLDKQSTFQYYSDRGWTIGLLTMVRSLSLDLAVLDTYESNVLPTREEAQYLFAQNQHDDRRLGSESWATSFRQQLYDELPWEQYHERQAREVLALPHAEGAVISQLHCRSQ
jgi:hypothetical protein